MQTLLLASCSWRKRCIDVDDNDPEKHILPAFKRVKIVCSPAEVEFPAGFDAQEDKTYAGDFVSYTPSDVTVHIFSFLEADKSFFARLKIVSKAWNVLLSTRWSQLSPKLTLSGLVCIFRGNFMLPKKNIYIHKINPSGTAKSYRIGLTHRGYILVDSNKGKLLFMNKYSEELTVYHASTGVLDHLPCALTSVSSENEVVDMNHGLIFSHGCYKVVSLFILSSVGTFFLKMFSSDTKEIVEVEVVVPAEVAVSPNEKVTSFFSFKGVLYYTILDWLFVYQLKDGCSAFIKLPSSGCVPETQRLIWQSEDHLYYSFGYTDPQPGFQLWELVLEQKNYHNNITEINGSKWNMKCSHFLADIKNEHTNLFKKDSDLSLCKPCAFNDDFQILYIELQGMLLSYHLKTRLFTKARNLKCKSYWGSRTIFPFYFGSEEDSSIMDYSDQNKILALYKAYW